jgi:cysteine-rich repeat protein
MNRRLVRSASLLLALTGVWATAVAQETIHFEGLQPGTIVSMVVSDQGSGPIVVYGANPLLAGLNAAVIFNSDERTGGDCDLGTPNAAFGGPGCGPADAGPYVNDQPLHNLLILDTDLDPIDPQSGLVTDPDDLDCSNMLDGLCARVPGATATLTFDFGALGAVTVESLKIVDADGVGPDPRVEMYGADSGLLNVVDIPEDIPNNGVAPVDLESTPGVVRMIVFLQGSGAVDDIVFLREPECGDGTVDAQLGETCDPPGQNAGQPDECRDDCTFCGDDVLQTVEQCDDGNNDAGDGCSPSCQNEDDEDEDEDDDEDGDEHDDDEDGDGGSPKGKQWYWH